MYPQPECIRTRTRTRTRALTLTLPLTLTRTPHPNAHPNHREGVPRTMASAAAAAAAPAAAAASAASWHGERGGHVSHRLPRVGAACSGARRRRRRRRRGRGRVCVRVRARAHTLTLGHRLPSSTPTTTTIPAGRPHRLGCRVYADKMKLQRGVVEWCRFAPPGHDIILFATPVET